MSKWSPGWTRIVRHEHSHVKDSSVSGPWEWQSPPWVSLVGRRGTRPFSDWRANVDIVCGKSPHSFPFLDVYRPETVPMDVREACQLRYYTPASLVNCVSNKCTELPECCSLPCAWLPSSVVSSVPSCPRSGIWEQAEQRSSEENQGNTGFLVLGYLDLWTTPLPSDGTPSSCRRTANDKHRIQLWRELCCHLRKAYRNAVTWESLLVFY